MNWQQMHDGLFWPYNTLLSNSLPAPEAGVVPRLADDYGAIRDRLRDLHKREDNGLR